MDGRLGKSNINFKLTQFENCTVVIYETIPILGKYTEVFRDKGPRCKQLTYKWFRKILACMKERARGQNEVKC